MTRCHRCTCSTVIIIYLSSSCDCLAHWHFILSNGPSTFSTPKHEILIERLAHREWCRCRTNHRHHSHCCLRRTFGTIWPKIQVQFAYYGCACACETHVCGLNSWWTARLAQFPRGHCNRSISFDVIIFVQKTLNTMQLIDTTATNRMEPHSSNCIVCKHIHHSRIGQLDSVSSSCGWHRNATEDAVKPCMCVCVNEQIACL